MLRDTNNKPLLITKVSCDTFMISLENHARSVCYGSCLINFTDTLYSDIFMNNKLTDTININSIQTNEIVIINTNGGKFEADVMKELSVYNSKLVISFYVNDLNNIDIHFLECLRKNSISFLIILPIMKQSDISKIYSVLKILEAYYPLLILLITPCITTLGEKIDLFFHSFAEEIFKIRKYINTPILMYPELYMVINYYTDSKVYVVGVIPESPFSKAGILPGDIIQSINGLAMNSRALTKYLLSLLYNEKCSFKLEYKRENKSHFAQIQLYNFEYPFALNNIAHYGCILNGLSIATLFPEIENIVNSNKKKNGLFIVSELTYNFFSKLLYDYRNNLYMSVVIGYYKCIVDMGNVFSVNDYVKVINKEKANKKIDYVILPSSAFYVNGSFIHDCFGEDYSSIEKTTNTRIVLLKCGGVFL